MDYGPESGLPSGRVFQLVEVDSRIWIRTEEGIAFYNGFMWHPLGSSEGLAEPDPTWLASNGRGGVLVAAGGRVFTGGSTGMEELPVPAPDAGWLWDRVAAVDSQQILLTARRQEGEARSFLYDGERLFENNPAQGVDSGLWITRAGSIWLDSSDGLHRFEDGRSCVSKRSWRPFERA